MQRIVATLLATLFYTGIMAQNFVPDILGENFESLTIEQGEAFDGEVVTTLVRHVPLPSVTRAVLYVHGYNDYFFQAEMAQQFISRGWQFYAVDLRRYGRSWREWQRPFAVREIAEYFEDIDAAVEVMRAQGIENIVLMGHSTGGLTTSLYAHHRRDSLPFDALILNSPFFDMNLGEGILENWGVPVVAALGAVFRDWEVLSGDDSIGGYGRSVSDKYDGEWAIDTSLKRLESLPITAAWLRAIHLGHSELQKGLDIPCPVLVLYSDNSVTGDYSPDYMSGDSVLDVEDIARYAPLLGERVDQEEIEGGMHDLMLSRPSVRYPLYRKIFNWLEVNG